MDDKGLYFIALLPPEGLSGKISVIKNNFAQEYQCSHALKVMPHITLQPPFKMSPTGEVEMHLSLQRFFESFGSFEIKLNGFGSFDKKNNKVIFIDVEESKALRLIHQDLMQHLRTELKFSDSETPFSFHPHITIAYRDLTSENFEKAWPAYKNRSFEASFQINSSHLLKHNFRKWELLSEFLLNKK